MRTLTVTLTLALGAAGVWGQELPSAPEPHVTRARARVLLTAGDAALAFTDTAYTQAHIYAPGAYERDPVARPIVRHAGAAYGVAAIEVGGLAWLGGRLERSPRWHRVWWMPQAVAIGLHAGALGQSVHSWKH